MSMTLEARFETRREAEMTVERLVQEHQLERTSIFISAEGEENSAGAAQSGSDTEAGDPSPPDRDDAALNGQIIVSVDIQDDAQAEQVLAAFEEFDARAVEQER